jgi:hypothetical protein
MNLTHELIPNVEDFRTRNQQRAELTARLLIGGLALNHFSIFCYSLLLIRGKGRQISDYANSYNWLAGFWALALFGMIVWACFRKSGRWYVNRVIWLSLTSGLSINTFDLWLKAHGIERPFPVWHFAAMASGLLLMAVIAVPVELTFSDTVKRKKEETD